MCAMSTINFAMVVKHIINIGTNLIIKMAYIFKELDSSVAKGLRLGVTRFVNSDDHFLSIHFFERMQLIRE